MSWTDTTDELFDPATDFPKFSPGKIIRYIAVDNDGDDQGESIGIVVSSDVDVEKGVLLDLEHLGSSGEFYAYWISEQTANDQDLQGTSLLEGSI